MTESDLQQIEQHVGFALPATYRTTLLNYPFEPGSFADEFMLPNRPQEVIELSDVDFSSPAISQEWYFVDASKPDSAVFVFELETGKHKSLSPTWTAYLDHIRATHSEIAADEAAERQRKQNKKWWQFWL
jgi:hypothetical protein